MKWVYKILPWCFAALFAAEIIAVLMPKRDAGFQIRDFGRLPVLLNGRIQPFDSVGLNSLREIRGTGDVPLEGNGADASWGQWDELRKNPKALPLSERKWWQFGKHPKKLKGTAWLLEVMMKPELADQRPIFMIHHPEILSELKLTEKGIENSGLHYFSYDELKPVREEIQAQALQIRKSATDEQGRQLPDREKLWTPVQKQMVRLENAIVTYDRLKNSLRPQTSDDFAQELADFQKLATAGKAAFRAQQEQKQFDQEALDRFAEPLNHYFLMSKWALPLIVPPLHAEKSRDGWINAGTAILEFVRGGGELHPAMTWFARMATAYRHDKPEEFNRAIAEYKQWLGG
ncbi:MAG TPA: hypothetical protein VK850_02150, partial [Candidatus Binatia bacterium]|nr:hypothetical protein [Candidatus Binatia bacterium]